MKKSFAVLSVVALAVSLTACASSTEPEAAAPSATESATPSPTPTPTATSASPKASDGTDAEVITTAKPAENALTEEEIAALPPELASVYNECMVGRWQSSMDNGIEYDEEDAAFICQIEMDMVEATQGVSQDQMKQVIDCVGHMETARPELFEGYSTTLDALDNPELKAACQEYLGIG